MNNLTKSGYGLLISLFFLISCGIEEPSLTSEEKFTVDTLFNNQLSTWRTFLDSSCNATKDTIFIRLADSLKEERMKDIESLLILNQEVQ